ncbi:hypothetical protein M9H77_21528 [Catharanthus roseus]|uniref:Uncharacterized protein n=1 Tax=Catharanthus roseus TaxID=4058 RepID=A0ACC0APB7_CATRO|nr:hypothetical protein M9H77_21528 [Catharanthus roseus]
MAPKKSVTSSSKYKRAHVAGTSPDLDISGGYDYYPYLVREFYTNMNHKTNKYLQTIISTVKGVMIILDRERLASILEIPDNGNSVIVDSNRKIIDEDLHTLVQKGGGFSEVRLVDIYLLDKLFNHSPLSLSSLIIQIMRNTECDTTKKRNQVWIPPSEEDRLRDRNSANFHKIKKTTQTGLGASSLQPVEDDDDDADESYNPSDNEEDEAGA